MQRCLNPLPALGNSLVRQADDVHQHLAGRDHYLHFDGYAFNPLKRHRTDARYHPLPSSNPFTAINLSQQTMGCNLAEKME